MKRERFDVILAAYGADPQRWPEAERADALAFVQADSDARAALDAVAELDALLPAAVISPQPSDTLTARLWRAAPRPEFFADWRRAAAAAALALVLGLGGGYLGGGFVPDTTEESYYEIAFDGLDANFDLDLEGGA